MTQKKTVKKWLIRLCKASLILAFAYVLFFASLIYFFDQAEQHKGFVEKQLTRLLERPVQIQQIKTAWHDWQPSFLIEGIEIAADGDDDPDLFIKSLAGRVNSFSCLKFWPEFQSFVVDQPEVKIETLENGLLKIAGIPIRAKGGQTSPSKRLFSWLLKHHTASLNSGFVRWHRKGGEVQHYQNIALVYGRDDYLRTLSLSATTPKGQLAFKVDTNGDLLTARDWGASFEILGNQGEQLIAKDRIKLNVEEGKGQLTLASLDVQRIADIIGLLGLSKQSNNWLVKSELSGRLENVDFSFSGPVLQLDDWQLKASALDIQFKQDGAAPGMRQLNGGVSVSPKGGVFQFSAEKTEINWSKFFSKSLPVDLAKGEFHWRFSRSGQIDMALHNGQFKVPGVDIEKLDARCEVAIQNSKIAMFADLFKVKSIPDLSYQDGEVVDPNIKKRTEPPLFLDARADFQINSLRKLEQYFPKITHSEFRAWWRNAFIQGKAKNGQISYQGEVNKTALQSGKAVFQGQAEFSELSLDYGYQRDWPRVLKAQGVITLDNDVISILPSKAQLEKNAIQEANVVLTDLFSIDRKLQIDGTVGMPLAEVTRFLFQGPLITNETLKQNPPFVASAGSVLSDISITIPLNKVSRTKVKGIAQIKDGQLKLPESVYVSNINGPVRYTEQSVETDQLKVDMLGGTAQLKLTTTEQAQPPKLRISGNGRANVKALKPWAGQHLLSLVDGVTPWQGDILIDNDVVNIEVQSELEGVTVGAPEPLAKPKQEKRSFQLAIQLGGSNVQNRLSFNYNESLQGKFLGDLENANTLYDQSMIRYSEAVNGEPLELQPGVHFQVEASQLNLDQWLEQIIELSQLPGEGKPDTRFLDAMRSISIKAQSPFLLGRPFQALSLSALSVDGASWIGAIKGKQINGTLQAEPRATPSIYRFNLANMVWPKSPESDLPPTPIDPNAKPSQFPDLTLKINSFQFYDKDMGRLELHGAPEGELWRLNQLTLNKTNITTSATGAWQNTVENGSLSNLELTTSIREVGDVMGNLDFGGIIKKGEGDLEAKLSWRGSPYEFDLSRLDGSFIMDLKEGELLKVEPGTGKVFGLLNINALARRLRLDFTDVFSSGLIFDKMHYDGMIASGDVIFRDAYIFSPAVYLRAEGRIGLAKQDADLDIHVSPELGGNLTLLSALANPTAGAVLFITQKLFQNELRNASFRQYRATGNWDQLTIEPISTDSKQESESDLSVSQTEPSAQQTEPSAQQTKPSAPKTKPSASQTKPSASQTKPSELNTEPLSTELDDRSSE